MLDTFVLTNLQLHYKLPLTLKKIHLNTCSTLNFKNPRLSSKSESLVKALDTLFTGKMLLSTTSLGKMLMR
jgi:hypothetical protein